jgi:outer membrane protein insertion porin family
MRDVRCKLPEVTRRRRLRLFVGKAIVIVCLWLPAVAYPASHSLNEQQTNSDLQGKIISRLEVYVNDQLVADPKDELYQAVVLKTGQPLVLTEVRRAIANLYQAALASYVSVDAEETADGVIVRFRVVPQARIGKVIFQGVDPDLQSQLIARLGELDPGDRLTQAALNRAADEIVGYYQGLGFFDCEVTPTVSLEDDGRTAAVVFRVNPGQPSEVGEVRLAGELKLDTKDLLSRLDTKPGTLYTSLRLQDDLGRLRDLHLARGYLAAEIGLPRIERTADNKAVKIEIPVTSGPMIDVSVTGIKLSPKTERQLVPLIRVGGLDDATLEEGRLNISDYVQRQGYFFANVKLVRTGDADRVKIQYVVDRGRKYSLRRIRIEGTTQVTLDRVADRLGSVIGGRFSRGLTSRELMEQDRQAISDYLRERGFRQARVVESRLAVTLKKEDLIIIYGVDDGARITVGQIAFVGNTVYTSEQLRAKVGLSPGEAFADARVTEASGRIAAVYQNDGYADAEVRSEVADHDDHQVRLLFHIREGAQLKVGQIGIRGNRTTTDEAIRTYLTFREGDLIRPPQLAKSEEELYTTGAFRRVTVTAEKTSVGREPESSRDVVVAVDEASRYQLTYGGGYRTDDGPRGVFEISNSNFLGRLNSTSFRLRASRREQIGQLSYTNPKPFKRDLPMLFTVLYQRQQEVAFDASRFTALAQLERQLNEKTFFFLRYNFSNVIITNVTQPEELRRQDSSVQLGRVSASLLRDMRDSPFDPTAGSFTTLDVSVVARYLGGSENFLRFFGEHQRLYRVPQLPETTFAIDTRLGLAWPFGRSFALPISERFFAGGSTTLRGFAFEQAGPRFLDPGRAGQTKPLGGNALAILNAELRFPMLKYLRLGGALFYDAGNVFSKLSDFSFADFTHTVGLGLRIKTPIGPLRIDFGMLVKRQPGVPGGQLHLTFGNPF